MPAEAAVDRWTGDAPHLNTMVSQNLTEIGAGVAISNGRVYYVIDAAHPATSGDPPAVATAIAGGSPVPQEVVPEIIIPVAVSTPNPDGNVFHAVKFGQTLWQIAIAYGVKIDDLKRLNNLFDNNIYPGSSLLIKQGVIAPSSLSTETPVPLNISTSLPTFPATAENVTITSTLGSNTTEAVNDSTVINVMIGIIALAIVGGGIITWLGSSRKK